MLELLYQSTKTYTLGISYSPEVIYLASWDAVLYNAWASTADFRKVFRDGTFFEMGSKASFSG
jgi:hypothetical protein